MSNKIKAVLSILTFCGVLFGFVGSADARMVMTTAYTPHEQAGYMANGLWTQEVEEREHPFGHSYFWLAGHYHDLEPNAEDTDKWALNNGYVAITPTTIDVTAYDMIEKAKTWNLELE